MTADQTPSANTAQPPVICVFCGASPGTSPQHMQAARKLAQAMHARGARLVYGGGTVGIMGEVARTLASLSGPEAVHGVIPEALLRFERQPNGNGDGPPEHPDAFGRTTVVKDMHTRKQVMAQEVIEGGPGSGFVALSGGYGTLEELLEITTWNQLGIHNRGIVVFNVDGYYDGLLAWVRKAVDSGFVAETNKDIMVEARTADEVIDALRSYRVAEGVFKLNWQQR
ncbi:hypothetical protein ANO11243_002710 [Dothideomycetidae sp. 11243]|nr:hypothetical protein ANO11243_002710 [fungal sp. No.11243]